MKTRDPGMNLLETEEENKELLGNSDFPTTR